MSVIALAGLLATQAPITLAYQPKVGGTYKFALTMAGTSQMGNSNTSLTNTQKVLSVSNGLYKVQSTNSNIKSPGSQGMKDMTNVMLIDKYGAIKPDPSNKDAMSKMMSGLGNSGVGLQFPKKPVKPGDTWSNTVDMGALMGNMMKGSPQGKNARSTGLMNVTFKLVKVDGSSASIACTFNGTMNMTMPGSPGAKGGPQTMTMSMKMSGAGQYSVERASGMLMNSNTKMNIDMGVMGQQMKMTQNITQKRI